MAARHPHFPRNAIPLSATIEAWIVIASIVCAWYLIHNGILAEIIVRGGGFEFIGIFIEGFFFTSVLTTAPAIVALVESSLHVSALELALIGALGAVCGDLLVFRFVQSRLVEYILRSALHPRLLHAMTQLSRTSLWWVGFLIGAIVIASPLPDEIGLLLMGLSHLRLYQFIPLVYAANAVGIYLIALTVQSIS